MELNNYSPMSGPDEPVHVVQCFACESELPQSGWEVELIPQEYVVAWFVYCSHCGAMNVENE